MQMISDKRKLAILLLIPGALLYWLWTISNQQQFTLVSVRKGELSLVVSAVGELESKKSMIVGCPAIRRTWEFTLTYLHPEGEFVKKGVEIIRFDDKNFRDDLQVAESELQTQQKELEGLRLSNSETLKDLTLQQVALQVAVNKAKNKTVVIEELTASRDMLMAKHDYEQAILNYDIGQKNLEYNKKVNEKKIRFQERSIQRLERRIEFLQNAIQKLTVLAPRDGIVVYGADWQGTKVKVGDRVWVDDPVIILPDLQAMQVKATIPEFEAYKIEVGQRVEIRLDAHSERMFHGSLDSLGRVFRTKSDEQPMVVFDALVTIETPDPEIMRPGMAARVNILTNSLRDVLILPKNAIRYSVEGTYVLQQNITGELTKVFVTIGKRSDGEVQIISGLAEGDSVIIDPLSEEDSEV